MIGFLLWLSSVLWFSSLSWAQTTEGTPLQFYVLEGTSCITNQLTMVEGQFCLENNDMDQYRCAAPAGGVSNVHCDEPNDWQFVSPGATTLSTDDSVVNQSTDPVHWSKIQGIPDPFADGTDDGAGGGSGTVTSVGLTMPAEFLVAGSPVTGASAIAVTEAGQGANTVYAGPVSGGATEPEFRALVDDDVPNTLTASAYLPLTGGTLTGALTTPSVVTSGATAGQVTLEEATANGNNFIAHKAPDARTTDLTLVYPTADPTAGQVLAWSAPSSGVSTGTFVDAGGSVPATVVKTDQFNTFTSGGGLNLAGADHFVFPTQAGAAPAASGSVRYDTTSNSYKAGVNGTTRELTTVTGTKTVNKQLAFDASGNVIASATDIGAGGSGSGDVAGPASSLDNQIVRYSGTGGKTIDAVAPLTVGDAGELRWTDSTLQRWAADNIVLQNGATPQRFMVTRNFTSSADYEGLSLRWVSDVATIRADNVGGTPRNLALHYANSTSAAITIPTALATAIDIAKNASPTTSTATNGQVRIADGSVHGAVTGTTIGLKVSPSFQTSSTSSAIGKAVQIAPIVNYSHATPGSGHYEALSIEVTETDLQTTTNYLITGRAGTAGTTTVLSITNAGTIFGAGGYRAGATGETGVTLTCSVTPTGITITGGIITAVTGGTCT